MIIKITCVGVQGLCGDSLSYLGLEKVLTQPVLWAKTDFLLSNGINHRNKPVKSGPASILYFYSFYVTVHFCTLTNTEVYCFDNKIGYVCPNDKPVYLLKAVRWDPNRGGYWLAHTCLQRKTLIYWMQVKSWQISAAGLQRVKTTNHSPLRLQKHEKMDFRPRHLNNCISLFVSIINSY